MANEADEHPEAPAAYDEREAVELGNQMLRLCDERVSVMAAAAATMALAALLATISGDEAEAAEGVKAAHEMLAALVTRNMAIRRAQEAMQMMALLTAPAAGRA